MGIFSENKGGEIETFKNLKLPIMSLESLTRDSLYGLKPSPRVPLPTSKEGEKRHGKKASYFCFLLSRDYNNQPLAPYRFSITFFPQLYLSFYNK